MCCAPSLILALRILKNFINLKKQKVHPLDPIPLRYRLTEEEIARLAVNEFRLEGVQVDAELVRYYPHGDLFCTYRGRCEPHQ